MVREVAQAGGSVPDHIRKVLRRGGPSGATLWVGNLGVDGSDVAKYLGVTRGFPEAGDGSGVGGHTANIRGLCEGDMI